MQNFSAGNGIAVTKHFEVSQSDLGITMGGIFQHAIETCDCAGPVTHKKVIVGGTKSDVEVARIEGQSAVEAGQRIVPASLAPIDAPDGFVDLGIIGQSRGGDLELMKSCVVFLLAQKKADTQSHMGFARGGR